MSCLEISAGACARLVSSRLPSWEAPDMIAEQRKLVFSVKPVAVSKQELTAVLWHMQATLTRQAQSKRLWGQHGARASRQNCPWSP